MEGLKIEGDVCCTQCGASSGKSVILGYKNKIGLAVYDTGINFFLNEFSSVDFVR